MALQFYDRTIAVNLGFLVGALASMLVGAADRVASQRLIGGGALGAALCNALLLLASGGHLGLRQAVALRAATGACLAFVYPPACKVAATWFRRSRGVALGVVVGAVVLGSALPHFINGCFGNGTPWEALIAATSGISAAGAVLALRTVRNGPFARSGQRDERERAHEREGERERGRRSTGTSVIRVADIAALLRNKGLLLACVGYCGHSWEIYGLWSWYRTFALDALLLDAAPASRGPDFDPASTERAASFIAFAVVAVGSLGCLAGGVLADRHGRTKVVLASCVGSAACGFAAGYLQHSVALVVAVGCVWGVVVVSDSAQYAAMATELCDPRRIGLAATLQFAFGYVLTVPTIYAVPALVGDRSVADGGGGGWPAAWSVLAVGPLVSALATYRLRQLPCARRLAGGKM